MNQPAAKKTDDKWLVPFDINPVAGEKIQVTPGTIRRLINDKASLEECHVFLNMCVAYRANPFLKDLHLVKYAANSPAAFVAGIGFFEKKAQLNPKFKGYAPTRWMNDKGEYHDIFVPNKLGFGQYPIACVASCHVEGYEEAQTQPASWDECFARKSGNEPNATWKKQPGTMLEKVAKVRLLRKLFSAELGGLYSTDEMSVTGAVEGKPQDDGKAPRVGQTFDEPIDAAFEEEPQPEAQTEPETPAPETATDEKEPVNFNDYDGGK